MGTLEAGGISIKIKGIKARWMVNSLGLVVVILLSCALIFCATIYNFYFSNISDQLESKVNASANFLNKYINRSYEEFLNSAKAYTEDYTEKDRIELQVIRLTGEIMYSSSGSVTDYRPGTPDSDQADQLQKTVRYTGTDSLTGQKVISVSAPLLYTNGEKAGVLRLVTATKLIEERVYSMIFAVLGVCTTIFLFVFISNTYFIRSIINPLNVINNTAKKIAQGNYSVQIEKKFDDEIGELADTINFMASEIGRTEQVKNDFISSVSHELRTPLTAITGWAETLQTGGHSLSEIEKRGLSVIVKESDHLRAMLEDLLDFSRMQSGRLTISKTMVDIAAVVEDVIFAFNQKLRQEGMNAIYKNESGELLIFCDSNRMRQVFINLIDNARKHASSGGVVEVTVSQEEEYAVILFRDHGPGIPENEISHVKDKFYKGSSRVPGSGIGLALCDEIVRMHGGRLDIESHTGQGSWVYVRLPLNEI